MLSQKLEDLAMAVGDMCGHLATGRAVSQQQLTAVQQLLIVHADTARQIESLTVPLHARRSGEPPADEKIVDLDRHRRRPIAGGGGAA
ncbi:hypothetical protein [Hypericibacter sp.]|uniref:hypothetical protein n=1 Tax=Hypericibacter sp. TaxID=2705401 RepID=UPI003D6CC333